MKNYHENGDLVRVDDGGRKWVWGIVVNSKEVFADTNQRDYEIALCETGERKLFYGPDVLTAEGEIIVYRNRKK